MRRPLHGASGRDWRVSGLFFNDTATTEIYTLSLHDALPIYARFQRIGMEGGVCGYDSPLHLRCKDRKSTRLNSSHLAISYAVFCSKKTYMCHQQHVSAHESTHLRVSSNLLHIT